LRSRTPIDATTATPTPTARTSVHEPNPAAAAEVRSAGGGGFATTRVKLERLVFCCGSVTVTLTSNVPVWPGLHVIELRFAEAQFGGRPPYRKANGPEPPETLARTVMVPFGTTGFTDAKRDWTVGNPVTT
jgi:hypothetical protein